MRKADIVILVLAVLAATATLVGALSGDRWTDERVVRFEWRTDTPLAAQGPDAVPASGLRYNWTAPANSTAATFTVDLAFSGQAVRGGTATVSLRVTSPDGTVHPPVTQAWAIGQGSTSAQTQVNATIEWARVPGAQRDTTSNAHGLQWDRPIEIQITVQPPSDVPLASYSFEATAAGVMTTYWAA